VERARSGDRGQLADNVSAPGALKMGAMSASVPTIEQRTLEGGSWETATAIPHPALAGAGARYCGYREFSGAPIRRRQPASALVSIIVSFGDPIEIAEMSNSQSRGPYCSFVVGLHDGFSVTEFIGGQHGIQLDLNPLAAFRLLAIPGSVLANELTPMELIDRPGMTSLGARLAEATGWAARYEILDSTLLGWGKDAPEVDAVIHWAWKQLVASGGRVPIARLVVESGRSHRWFTERFRTQIGLGPKEAASVLRFRCALRQLRTGSFSIAEVAASAGYSDQSHLSRAFQRLAGCPPAALLQSSALVNFVQDGSPGPAYVIPALR
jgi:AraC-like DNA-binding protein